MNDYFTSLIRTWVPVAVGFALTWLARTWGIGLDDHTGAMATAVAVALVIGVYYAAARLVEEQWPGLGKILVALGLGDKPAYTPPQKVRM